MSAGQIALPFFVSLAVSALLTPCVARVSRMLGVVDRPNDRKVSDREQMPLMGGLAVAAGVGAGLLAVHLVMPGDSFSGTRIVGFLVGGGIVLALGAYDDRFGMGALVKLSGQIAAATVAFLAGYAIEGFRFPMFDGFELQWWMSYAATVFWIVAVTNAVNLIDGLDGLAAGISIIMATTMTYVCIDAGQTAGIIFGAVIIGGTLGFLPYNFPPAKIFLGDTGALYLGFSISLLAMEGYLGGYRRASFLPFVVPLMALAVPMMDMALSVIRRLRSGTGIFSADREHMHHRLLRTEGSHTRAVIFLYLLTACFCSISVYFVKVENLRMGSAVLLAVLILTIRLVRNLGGFADPNLKTEVEAAAPILKTGGGEKS